MSDLYNAFTELGPKEGKIYDCISPLKIMHQVIKTTPPPKIPVYGTVLRITVV